MKGKRARAVWLASHAAAVKPLMERKIYNSKLQYYVVVCGLLQYYVVVCGLLQYYVVVCGLLQYYVVVCGFVCVSLCCRLEAVSASYFYFIYLFNCF